MDDLYTQAGQQYNVDPLLLRAQAIVESGENDNAVSPAGALGRMQFMPATAAEYGISNPRDAKQSVYGAAAKMNDLLNQHGNPVAALMAYNGGNPSRWNNPETQAYPVKVAAVYQQLKQAQAVPPSLQAILSAPDPTSDAPATTAPVPQSLQAILNSPDPAPGTSGSPQTTLSGVGNSILRGVHQATDAPAAALASGADWLANKLGYQTNFTQDATAPAQAFNAAYDADPNNQGIAPMVARGVGNALVTIPAAIGAGKLVEGPLALAGAAIPGASGVTSVAAPVASGAAQGAVVNAMNGDSAGQGALAGGVLGGALGLAGAGVNALMGKAAPLAQQAVDQYGIPLRAGQTSGNRFVRYLDSAIGNLPGSGMDASNAAQRVAFNQAVARTFGENASEITPNVMQAAKDRIGGVMNDIASRTNIPVDGAFLGALGDIQAQAQTLPHVAPAVSAQVNNIVDTAIANGGTLPGEAYKALTAQGSPLDKALHAGDPSLRDFAVDIRNALDDAFQRAASPEDAQALSAARLQYKNMMTVAPLVNSGEPGAISPLRLQAAANRSFKQNAFRGAGALGTLGDIGQTYLKPPPDSGTAMRMAIYNNLGDLGGLVRGAVGTATGRTVGTMLRANPVTGYQPPVNMMAPALLLRNRLLAPSLGDQGG